MKVISTYIPNGHLPLGWNWSTLDQSALILAGNPAPQGERFFKGGAYPFVRVFDMGQLDSKCITKTRDYINDEGKRGLRIFPKGAVLFTKSGASTLLNQRAILGQDSFVVSHIAAALPRESVISEWIYYWLKIVDFNHIAHATTLPSLPLSKIKNIPIPITSEDEQRRIVAEIEKQLTRLEAGISALKRVQANLKRYRKTLLNAAYKGEIISTGQRSWKMIRAGDVLDLINGRTFKSSEWTKSGVPIIRIQNLNNPDAPFNYYQGKLPEKFMVNNGDLLFAWSGTPGTSFGAHIWRGGKSWLNQHIFKVQFDKNKFNMRFLQLGINQNLAEYIRAAHGAAGLAHITKGKFESSQLPVPSLDQQEKIVAELDRRLSVVEELEVTVKLNLDRATRLRQSILQKAFSGGL